MSEKSAAAGFSRQILVFIDLYFHFNNFLAIVWTVFHGHICARTPFPAKINQRYCPPPWRPPQPHMTTFPWSYGYDITPIVIKLPILYFNTVGQFYRALNLHRWPAYAICIVILHLFCVLLYLVCRLPIICQNCAILSHIPERNIIRSLGAVS